MEDPTQPVPDTVTVCITSCARLDLLEASLASFRLHHPGGTYLISEDSADPDVIAQITRDYPEATVLSGSERLGIMKSIDRLYEKVTTPYIFHTEDDWQFDGPINWHAAIALLESNPLIANVCVRTEDEIKPKYRKRSRMLDFEGETFRIMDLNAHPEYFSWSPNPGLIQTELYHRFRPFGALQPDRMSGVMKEAGLTMAFHVPGVARHLGQGRNVVDPTMPARPTSRVGKFMRGVRKKLYYAGLRNDPF